MLTFNDTTYKQILTDLGVEAKAMYPYKELITSEIAYQNHFLHYLNEHDIDALLVVDEQNACKLQEMFQSIKALREQQKKVLAAFCGTQPEQWLQALLKMVPYYEHYLRLSLGMMIPEKVDAIFKEREATKIKEHHPQLGGLSAVLIAPVQRLPRYFLLGRELLRALDKKLEIMSEPSEKLLCFRQGLIHFLEGMNRINQRMNNMLASVQDLSDEPEIDDEPTSPYMQPSGRLHPLKDIKCTKEVEKLSSAQEVNKRARFFNRRH